MVMENAGASGCLWHPVWVVPGGARWCPVGVGCDVDSNRKVCQRLAGAEAQSSGGPGPKCNQGPKGQISRRRVEGREGRSGPTEELCEKTPRSLGEDQLEGG